MNLFLPNRTHNRLQPQHCFLLCLLPCLLLVSNIACSDALDKLGATPSQNQSSSITTSLSPVADFLPVHEAYQLDVEVQADKLLLHWNITEGYFLYGEQFGVELTQDRKILDVQLQKESGEISYDDYFQRDVSKFYRETTLTVLLPEVSDVSQKKLQLRVDYQGCAEAGLCYPPETLRYNIDTTSLTAELLPASTAANTTDNTKVDIREIGKSSFALMFLFAIFGGLILNLMPCVFPVLTIKLISFTRSRESASHLKAHSWFYTFGVLSTFLLTALLLIVLRKAGATIGWGYQLQSPVFVSLLAILFLVLALNMSDFINIGTRWMGVGQQLTAGDHYTSSFFTGVLAVIVASPCSVPFMGVALGYALTQPTAGALVIFSGLGIGLSLPFLIFAYVPWLIQHLPKPGPWMEKLKHWLALPLYIAAIWLAWVLWNQLTEPVTHQKDANQHWETYSAETLSDYLTLKEPVFVELTADWCITCLVNEKMALTRPAVLNAIKENKIHYLRGDWTNRDAEITELLNQYQRGGVPLYLYYDKNGTVTVLPQILTEQSVLDVLTH